MHRTNSSRIFEIILVGVTGLGKFIFVDYLHLKFWYVVSASLLLLAFIIFRISMSKGILNYWGFRSKGFRKSLKVALPVALISIAGFVIYGIINKTLILNWHILPILLLYPVWGTLQQFLIIGLLAGNLKDMEGITIPKDIIIFLSASVFSIVHFPSWPLVAATFLLAIFYSALYLRYRNLWVPGIFHGWLGGLFYFFVLHRDPWLEFLEAVK